MPHRFPFRLLSATPVGDHVPDSDLLGRFVRERDSAAFELLVLRHAAAVWTACRRITRTEHDAEDAFQAVFLILARKAGSVRGACVGGWLHRVAVNTSKNLRARCHPQSHQDGSLPEPTVDPGPGPEEAERAGVVQEELAQLPERYRLPVVLCDLEGHTHAQAATTLGWPIGSVSGRLSRARALLRKRLTQRGLAPAVGAALIVPAAGVPAGVVRAAVAAVTGTATIPVLVSILAEGVLSAMRIAKRKLAAVVVLSAGLLALGGGTLVGVAQMPAPLPKGEPQPKVDAPPKAEALPKSAEAPRLVNGIYEDPTWEAQTRNGAFPEIKAADPNDAAKSCPRVFGQQPIPAEANDDTYRRLLKASLYQNTRKLSRIRMRMEIGQLQWSDYVQYQCVEEMRSLATELWADQPKTLIPWLEEFLIVAKSWERFSESRISIGQGMPESLDTARAHRLRVEAALWKAKNPKPVGR